MEKKFVCTADEPVVKTDAGKLRGYIYDGVYTFHGIKYADAERFQMPHPVEHWDGIKDAVNYGYVCPIMDTPLPKSELYIPHRFWPMNENCQYLNIWTTSLDGAEKKPVFVWLHGGGFSDGSGIEQVSYEGDNLAKKSGMVVVTLNHRLNILGYMDLSSYSRKYDNSVNVGIADLVAALVWIKRNISAFGGDPDNVTIIGQSGGGGKVEALLQTPAAEGLFHRGILMSGVIAMPQEGDFDYRRLASGIMKRLGIEEKDVEKLETVPYGELARAAQETMAAEDMNLMWGPVGNGWIKGDPLKVGFSEYAKRMPLMAGSVATELGSRNNLAEENKRTEEEKMRDIEAQYGNSEKLVEIFRRTYPGKDIGVLQKIDTLFKPQLIDFAEAHAKEATGPLYLYQFNLTFDIKGGACAWHCSDIPFVFRNTSRIPSANIQGVTEKLEGQVSGSFSNFARNGNPNGAGVDLPEWLPYTEDHRITMLFDRKCEARPDFDTELQKALLETGRCQTWDSFNKKKNPKAPKDWIY
ncbi:MAG: carboxylesterase/lipase family protein [Oscillospiraceae bacterium]